MVVLVQQEKKLVKQIQDFTYVYILRFTAMYIKQIFKFKAKDNISWYNFCLGSKSKDFTKNEQSEISLNGTVYDFSVSHSSIKKEDILNIHQYLMIKYNIK